MDQEKTYKWIQDRIRDLHAGKLSAEDRLRMEELAKTDPFVQDAMEGYQANPDHDHSVLLKVIADRIQNKKESRRSKILPLSKGWLIPAVAASLVMILATWVVMFYIEKQGEGVFVAAEPESSYTIDKSTEVNLADADSLNDDFSSEPAVTASSQSAPAEAKVESHVGEKTAVARKDVKKAVENGPASIVTKPIATQEFSFGVIAETSDKQSEDETLNAPVYSTPEPLANQPPAGRAVETMSSKSQPSDVGKALSKEKRDEGYYANQMNPDLMSLRVSGKIIDERTLESIPYASITIANTNIVEMSDLNGDFDFYISQETAEIVVDYTGYLSTSRIVKQGEKDITIKLNGGFTIPDYRSAEEANRLSLESKHAHFLKVDTEDFRQYLNSNSIFPLASTYDPFGKMVKLEFTVTKGQKIEKIKVIKSSVGKQYEEEAIRLLKSGPAWRCEDEWNFPCTREYTIYFK